ncbi:type II secretion system protein [bacterium]|nr:type II secretion system protein [bacterium]
MINEEQKARGQEDKLVNPSPQPSPTRGEGVNSRVDFSLPLITGLPRSLRSLAMKEKNPTTTDATLTPHPSPLTTPLRCGKQGHKVHCVAPVPFAPQGAREKKAAFTLAEVLITLGIIGIVAAMTLPALVSKYKEQVFVNAAKKNYSTILNALNLWNSENGTIGDYSAFWLSNNQNELTKEFAKLVNAVNVCTNYNVGRCGGSYQVKFAQKTNNGQGKTSTESTFNLNRIVLADGSFISIRREVQNGNCTHDYWSYEKDENGNYIPDSSSPNGFKGELKSSNNCGFIYFDTNGLKGPNQVGIDCFGVGFIPEPNIINTTRGNLSYVLSHNKLIKTETYEIGDY